MRINNSKVKSTIISVYFVLVMLFIIFAFLFGTFGNLTSKSTLISLFVSSGFVILFFVVHYISKYFEYDSDGLKVVVTNKGLLLSDRFNYREQLLEFEKNELYAFKFKNYFIYKTLTFYLKNKRDRKTNAVFNITLVNRRKRRYIRQSLDKIIKSNKNSAD
ncbi:hypothetical protein A9Q86_09230 [Flavobacteriales bacterium 33_180_T64]|nr:hypothetical protein A9Q86_09230 [Flavobacteriales bacterium 33_180_T64]